MKKYLFIAYLCLSSSIYGSSFLPNFSDMSSEEIEPAKEYHNAMITPHLLKNPKKRREAAIKSAKGGKLDEVATELMKRGIMRIKIWYKIQKYVYPFLKLLGATLVILAAWIAIKCGKSNKVPPQIKGQDNSEAEENEEYLKVVECYNNSDINGIRKIKDKYGNNALHMACEHSDNVEMVTWLLDTCNIPIESKGGSDKKTPFLFAAEEGYLDTAKLLRQRGADISITTRPGDNALHLACCSSGSKAMVEWLLDECKIGLESKGMNQATPFLCAAGRGQLEIAKLLRKRGANIGAKSVNRNALHLACFSGSVAMVTWLLDECKIGLESRGYYQRTPFLTAAAWGRLAIAELFKQRGANIHAKDKKGNNALDLTCICSKSEAMMKWLLDECKIGLESKTDNQMTPFLVAAQVGALTSAKLLRQRGANIHAKDKKGNNALHLACSGPYSRNLDMITWLLDVCEIGLESKGQYDKTPFLCAVEGRELETAKLLKASKLLRERGANIHATDKYGKNALYYATESGRGDMITYVRSLN